MPNPRVTILMATWDRRRLLGRAVQSALDQTFGDWELIIAGDGPPPETEAIIHEWEKKDERVKYIRGEHTGRIAVISNVGLRAARGEYVAILDDDDWWLDPQKLAKQVAFLDSHTEYIGCGGGFVVVDGDGQEIGRTLKPETDEEIRRILLYSNPMANSASVFRREVSGLFDETMAQFADWDFWLRLAKKGKLFNFQEYFLAYRMWQKGASFRYQKDNADAAFAILLKHKNEFPGFYPALFLITAYWIYARFPLFVRRNWNSSLSQLKKRLFSH